MDNYTFQPIQTITFPAGSNQAKYKFLKLASGKVSLCGAGEQAIGVSVIDFTEDRACQVISAGIVPVTVGSGGVSEGDLVVSDSTGRAVPATAITLDAGATPVTSDGATPTITGGLLPEQILGIALSDGSENDVVSIKLK